MIIRTLKVFPTGGLIWVGDEGSEDFPPYLGGSLIEHTNSLVMVGTRSPSQGSTKLILATGGSDPSEA